MYHSTEPLLATLTNVTLATMASKRLELLKSHLPRQLTPTLVIYPTENQNTRHRITAGDGLFSLEPLARIELATFSLRVKRSAD